MMSGTKVPFTIIPIPIPDYWLVDQFVGELLFGGSLLMVPAQIPVGESILKYPRCVQTGGKAFV
jgi:hypothetical protein